MANSTANLASLLQGITIDDDNEVLEAANNVLKTSKNNFNALHSRVVALLKLDRFEDALRALDDGGDKLADRCVLEKAYALYKTGQLEEAAKIAQAAETRGLKHIAAQVAYRAENFRAAALHYKELSSQDSIVEGEDTDLRINILATDAQLEWQGNGDLIEQSNKKPVKEDLDAFETSYNAACGFIARGDLKTCGVFLKRARDLCQASDEMSDEEKSVELLPIIAQEAYVLMMLGKIEEAKALHTMVNIDDIPELVIKAVAQNNSLILARDENPYTTQRSFDLIPKLTKSEKLFSNQTNILQRNQYVISVQTYKFPGVARSTAQIPSNQSPTISPHVNLLSVINAAAHAKNQSGKLGLKAILPLLEKRPNDVGLIMIIVQLYIQNNNPEQAVSLLETFLKRLEESKVSSAQDIRFAPGLVAILVTLYRITGRKAPIISELTKAALYWSQKNQPCVSLLRAAGVYLLESPNSKSLTTAREIFKLLLDHDPNSKIAMAGYIASHSSTELPDPAYKCDKLTPVSDLVAGIDAAALEKAGAILIPSSIAISKKRSAEDKKAPSKKRKLSKKRTPKDYVEGKALDPERWLPLRDRSYYRVKGKKGKKKTIDSTQGGIVKEPNSITSTLGSGPGVVKDERTNVTKTKKKKNKK
ncbi:hypothetical protein K3495_g462 [Podosphaera aphanis]|nr:hypothetical protein K3495_g462 [Podosphaera aphanis]